MEARTLGAPPLVFDAQSRLVEVVEPDPNGSGTVASNGLKTSYAYDTLGNLTLATQGDQTRSFKYDALRRLTNQKLAERDATLNDAGQYVGTGQWSDVFSYDTRSNLVWRKEARGVKTLFNYNGDPLNRLQAVQYDTSGVPGSLIGNIPSAPNVNYVYLTSGDKTRAQNVNVDAGLGNETFSYDLEGRLAQASQTFPGREGNPLQSNYLWDSLDRLKELNYPAQYGQTGNPRKKVEPAYDIASRTDSLKFDGTNYAANFAYNAASQVESLNIGSLMAESYSYDTKTGLLLTQQVKQGAATRLDLKYNYTLNNDANNTGAKTGQLTGVTDLLNSSRNKACQYDKLGRLKEARGGSDPFNNPNWTQSYSYDRYGNRTSVTKTGPGAGSMPLDGLTSLVYTNAQSQTLTNRITTAGYEYDPAGNQTRGQTENGTWLRYKYDSAGRLAQALSDSSVVLETYSYGASNERLVTSNGSGATTFYAWESGQVIAEFSGVGASGLAWNKNYVYLDGRLLATTTTSGTQYHHPDRLGTRLVTDGASGNVTTEQTNLPLGTALATESSGAINNRRCMSYDRSQKLHRSAAAIGKR